MPPPRAKRKKIARITKSEEVDLGLMEFSNSLKLLVAWKRGDKPKS